MKRSALRVEFETTLGPDGLIRVPRKIREAATGGKSVRVRVQLSRRSTAERLRALGVDDEEVDRIAGLQSVASEQIIRCLLSEGACTGLGRRRGSRWT